MRSPITKIAMLLFGIILSVTAKAQIVTTNPLEYVALAEGNELILGKVKDQMDGQKKTALLQNTIAAEFEQMRQWEKKYNSYLKTASGFASSLKACTHLYNDGVRIFISLCKLKKAISDNPQGIVAAMSMNNLYIETATELVTYSTVEIYNLTAATEQKILKEGDRIIIEAGYEGYLTAGADGTIQELSLIHI